MMLNLKEMVAQASEQGPLIQQALVELVGLYVKGCQKFPPSYSDRKRWSQFEHTINLAIKRYCQDWNDEGLKSFDSELMTICAFDFSGKFIVVQERTHFDCFRDILSVLRLIVTELQIYKQDSPQDSIDKFRYMVFQSLKTRLYAKVAGCLIMDTTGFVDGLGRYIDDEDEDNYECAVRDDGW